MPTRVRRICPPRTNSSPTSRFCSRMDISQWCVGKGKAISFANAMPVRSTFLVPCRGPEHQHHDDDDGGEDPAEDFPAHGGGVATITAQFVSSPATVRHENTLQVDGTTEGVATLTAG